MKIEKVEVPAPHSIEAEQQLIGGILANNSRYHELGSLVKPEHFFDPVHARIWEYCAERISHDGLASPITIRADMELDEGLKELGGPAYLMRLVGAAISSFALKDYALLVVEMYERRKLFEVAKEAQTSLADGGSAADVVSKMELAVTDAVESGAAPRSMSLLSAMTTAIEELQDRRINGVSGISSGLTDLDAITGGFHPAEFTLLAGATSMGKTTFGTWIAYVAAQAGYGVGFASLEMGESQLYQRVNSIDSGIPYQAMRHDVSENTMAKIVEAASRQGDLPIQIFSPSVREIPSILSETKRLQKRWIPNGNFKGLGLLVIDYVQMIKGKGSTLDVLSHAANECKTIAKLLNIAVVGLAQVGRDVSREIRPPRLFDLRGSADLEFAADNVIFCHRPEYYLERALQDPPRDVLERADLEAELTRTKGVMDLIVAKQRMGAIGQCRIGCNMGTNRFWDMPKQQEVAF